MQVDARHCQWKSRDGEGSQKLHGRPRSTVVSPASLIACTGKGLAGARKTSTAKSGPNQPTRQEITQRKD